MNNLPKATELDFDGKSVLIRGDFNVNDAGNLRADSIRDIVNLVKSKGPKRIKVIGHTETDFDLAAQLKSEYSDVEFDSGLRNNPGEKENSEEFARQLADGWDIYINEAFSASHREHASIVGVPRHIKNMGGSVGVGMRFFAETQNLSRVFYEPIKPVIMVISGVKEDKLSYIESFSKFADKILIAGRLPEIIRIGDLHFPDEKVKIADLIQDKEDITMHSVERFEEEIGRAGTIVVSGPIGKFEDEGHRQGTERVFKAVVSNTNAFKVAGGGNTEKALDVLGVAEGFNWVSVGGGAMLDYLANGTLPGIETIES